MHLDVFDVYCCRSCVFIIYAPRDLYGCSRWIILTLKMTQDTTGCLRCLSMHKLRLDAPRDSYWCSRWPLMQLNVFNVYRCTSCASMHQNNYMDDPLCIWMSDVFWCRSCVFVHQGIYMDGQDDPWCSQMSINAQVVSRCPKTFIWMIKMTLDASGCLVAQVGSWYTKGFKWMLKITYNVAGCLGCLLMNKDAPTYFYGCPQWPLMQLDVLDVYWCTSCVLKRNEIDMDDQCNPWCIWMSWMTIDAQVVSWCTMGFMWML